MTPIPYLSLSARYPYQHLTGPHFPNLSTKKDHPSLLFQLWLSLSFFPLGRAPLLKQLAALLAGRIGIPPTHSSTHSNPASPPHHCRATSYLMRNSMQASLIVSFYLSGALDWAPVTKPSAMCQAIIVFFLLWHILFCFLSLLC